MNNSEKIIVIGTSAGGRNALETLFQFFPEDVDIPVVIVQHLHPDFNFSTYNLDGKEAKIASHQEHIHKNKIYISPADHHLLLFDNHMYLSNGPAENHFRPSIDALFRSAAVTYGPNAMGIILTGRLYDGASGLHAIKRCGGTAIVQDPNEAEFPSMPETAILHNKVDQVLKLQDIGKAIKAFNEKEVVYDFTVASDIIQEVEISAVTRKEIKNYMSGVTTNIVCPDCGGSLWEIKENDRFRYRCGVGHAYTQEALNDFHEQNFEESIWIALRVLEERQVFLKNLINQYQENNTMVEIYRRRLQEVEFNANKLRNFFKIRRED